MVKTITKVAGILLLALVVIAAGALILRSQVRSDSDEGNSRATVSARLGEIEETVSATGIVAAERQATLAFATSGQIDEVLIEAGDEVEAGSALARLDTETLEWQAARAEASLATAQRRLAQAQVPASDEDLAAAQKALDSALANLARVEEGATESEIESARAALNSTLASLEQVEAGPTAESLASAQAAVDSATAALQQAQASYDRVQHRADIARLPESLNLQNATIELERAQANYDDVASHPTESELAAAEAQVAQAEATLTALLDMPTYSELAAAEAQVAQASAQLAALQQQPDVENVAVLQSQVDESAVALAQAQAQLDDALIIAPFAGTVLEVQAREGEWTTPGAPSLRLAAMETMILEVQVDEVDVALLEERQTAYISFDAIRGKTVAGTISHISPVATNASGAVAYSVDISFVPESEDGEQLLVRLGMTADVEIVVAREPEALLVPNQAVEADRAAGRYYATLAGPGDSVRREEIAIGLRDESHTQVLAGIEAGDQVILPQVPVQVEDEGGSFIPTPGNRPFGDVRP
jgi:multidrug efflux pump subunit AcrA (membrane-fusion protein)